MVLKKPLLNGRAPLHEKYHLNSHFVFQILIKGKMSQIQAEYYVTLWCECQTLANR